MGRPPGVNFNDREREELRTRAVTLLVQGRTEREVGEALGISHSSVGRLWAKQRERWQEEHEELVQRELDKLDYIEAEHWRAYQQSKVLVMDDASGTTANAPTGDPDHLDRVLAVMQERARRLGLYPPRRVAAVREETEPRVVMACPEDGDYLAFLKAVAVLGEDDDACHETMSP